MNATTVLAPPSSTRPTTAAPTTAAPTTSERTTAGMATALQDMVDRLLQDALPVRAAAQPLCLCWVESRD